MNLKFLEISTLDAVRNMKEFPFKTGHLKWDATYSISKKDGFCVVFDTTKAPYINFLEYGTKKHLISNAFGRGITIMHPGSKKHVGFIKQKAVKAAIDEICRFTGGELIR